jgi:predicted RNase H-like HicB family nuclease
MRKVNAIIERASDGTYSIYSDADDLGYLVTGTGQTVEEAKKLFEGGYSDIKKSYERHNEPFTEVEMVYQYDTAAFLANYTKAFTLAGLSRITGINQGQLSHYVTGHRVPSARTKEKIQKAIHDFASELLTVRLA